MSKRFTGPLERLLTVQRYEVEFQRASAIQNGNALRLAFLIIRRTQIREKCTAEQQPYISSAKESFHAVDSATAHMHDILSKCAPNTHTRKQLAWCVTGHTLCTCTRSMLENEFVFVVEKLHYAY